MTESSKADFRRVAFHSPPRPLRADGTQRMISLRRDDLERRFPGLVDVLTR